MSLTEEAERIRARMQSEDVVRVSIALFGQPGAGKSSLINRLTGQRLAREGVKNDITTDRQEFQWNGLTLVDLPGYDTEKFPADEYLARFGVLDFDLLLCVFDGKFHEADSALFQEVTRRGKVCLFVRNKHDTLWQEDREVEDLECEVTENVVQQIGEDHPVFFTSCRLNTGLAELETAIRTRLDPAKKDRWVRAAKAYTREFLEEKRELCERRLTWAAAASAASGTIPIPGANLAVDVPVLVSFFKFVRDTYGLTDAVLTTKEYALPTLAPLVNGVVRFASTEGVVLLLKQSSALVTAEQISKYIPFVGSVIAASLGFLITRRVGSSYLTDCHRLAEVVLDARLKALPGRRRRPAPALTTPTVSR